MNDREGNGRNSGRDGALRAVLGPTNTGKTHLAIERLCGHSSGMIGFPLRLLAREVYDRVVAIKGERQVALITGEERIEPPDARWLLCTAEAMPMDRDCGFVAIDEAQLGADRERGHIFTDRMLHARGRDETMILGSATVEPMVRALLPTAEIVSRPRFSTLSHAGAKKLSRVPPRSAIVAFSAEQVYAVAELLRRFRGGAAVVMGALSPETRNKQVAMYQAGEVDYLVATDAIGMGLNLDLDHVAFAGLSKFDGQRQRRLTTPEMAQIAGRAGRHHRDGTFGTLSGTRSHDAEFTPEEVYAIEEHRFPPLTRLFWRDADPRTDSLDHLIEDLCAPPERPELAPAPEAIDLAVMRRLAEDPDVAGTVRGRASVERFRDACMLPDFRQHGAEVHARFVARLWEDLRRGALPTDYVAARIADLDNPQGDIDALQGRIAAIRSWAYIAQRPDWVLAREEMAARARAVEARLSDALHSRLTERFVNRRMSVLLRGTGADSALLPVQLNGDEILVDGEPIGKLEGFRFKIDPAARQDDRKLLFAAAEKHLPQVLAERAAELCTALEQGTDALRIEHGEVLRGAEVLARLAPTRDLLKPRLQLDPALDAIPQAQRETLSGTLQRWLAVWLGRLETLNALDEESRSEQSTAQVRAIAIRLVEEGGVIPRRHSGVPDLLQEQRQQLRQLKVKIGALDVFVPAMLGFNAQSAWNELASLQGRVLPPVPEHMPSVLPLSDPLPQGYRRIADQAVRVDLVERLVRHAHEVRVASMGQPFALSEAKPASMALLPETWRRLLDIAGFVPIEPQPLPEGAAGPEVPTLWRWLSLGERAAAKAAEPRKKGRPPRRKPGPGPEPGEHAQRQAPANGQQQGQPKQARAKKKRAPAPPRDRHDQNWKAVPDQDNPFAALAGLFSGRDGKSGD